ncbi:MAG: NUDIX domain-containing protein [Candidatus Pacebacteria bacterium]|nr:NUDIX domain-containing protein [Candidatus Paceibacterota bacterium]
MEKLIITEEYLGHAGVKYIFEYYECDSFDHLPKERLKQCYAVAFYGEKIVIVHDIEKNNWGLVGGSIEENEHPDETLIREIQEESNMKVTNFKLIGYQKVIDTRGIQESFYQLRYFAIVEKIGEFESDPAGFVDKILCINPKDYKKYFDWGKVGENIIKRALEFKEKRKS